MKKLLAALVLALGLATIVNADVVCVGGVCPAPTPTAAPTAAPAPTFPSTGNLAAVTIYYTEVDNGNSGTSKTIDWTAGNNQKITTTGNCTLTFTAPAGPASLSLRIIHEASATVYTYTWPGTVKWPSASAIANTNTSGAVDFVSCKYNGTNYYCVPGTNFS